MAATSLGTTGNFGIVAAQTGVILTDLSFDFSNEEKEVLNISGDVIGLTSYKEKTEVKLSGLVPTAAAFDGKLTAALTLANAVPAHTQAAVGGTTITKSVSRTLNNEDFEKIEITATNYPLLVTA